VWFMVDARFDLPRQLVFCSLLAVIALSAFVMPAAAELQQQSIRDAAFLARERGWDVIMWRLNAPSFSVYYGRPTPHRQPAPGDIVLTRARRLTELSGVDYQVIYANNGIVLVGVTPASGQPAPR